MAHFNQYPVGTEAVYSYFESRLGAKFNKTVFFGLQYLIKENLVGEVVDSVRIGHAKHVIDGHLGQGVFNADGWRHILDAHGGRLPIRIKAVPEGTSVDTGNVLMTVENTDPECYWLTNFLETMLTHVWSASTVATLSREVKIMLDQYLEWTAMSKDLLPFQLHDFGYRGVSSVESAGFEGAGHLVNFMGTDTVAAIQVAMEYYNSGVCAYSVPATEHSVMTALGREGEVRVLDSLLGRYPRGILSVVIDSYDYLEFIKIAGEFFRDDILHRDGKVVFRPDSGDPIAVTNDVMNELRTQFGCTVNAKGYKVLNPKVGVLWGDGIDYNGIRDVLHSLKDNGWSAENIVFGMGGGLLQKINRDTQRFAFKSSAQKRDGVWHDIHKEPRDTTKRSKKGRLALVNDGKKFTTVEGCAQDLPDDRLVTVFEDGKLMRDWTFDEIRERTKL